MNRRIHLLLLGTLCALAPAGFAITPTEAENILFMKQEEKLARDVYVVLAARWDHPTFANIAVSEQRHMDAVDGLIRRFRLRDTTPTEPGQFSIPELQARYDELVTEGGQSLAQALAVGVLVEETDIADLDEVLNATRDRTIRQVMSNLRRGSLNHLAAFSGALDSLESPAATGASNPECLGLPERQGGPGSAPRRPASRQGGRQ